MYVWSENEIKQQLNWASHLPLLRPQSCQRPRLKWTGKWTTQVPALPCHHLISYVYVVRLFYGPICRYDEKVDVDSQTDNCFQMINFVPLAYTWTSLILITGQFLKCFNFYWVPPPRIFIHSLFYWGLSFLTFDRLCWRQQNPLIVCLL